MTLLQTQTCKPMSFPVAIGVECHVILAVVGCLLWQLESDVAVGPHI